jgi:hypothetical protein
MGYEKKTTHIDEGLDNLVDQFEGSPLFNALLTSFLEQIQDLEDALSDVLTETTVESSVGAQLDALGSIVGEDRAGRNDLQYSTALRARLILNVSEGTPENIIDLIRAIAGDVTVQIFENFPASFLATIVDPIDPTEVDVTQIGALVASGRPAGIEGVVTFGVIPAFQYDTGTGFDEGKYGGSVLA